MKNHGSLIQEHLETSRHFEPLGCRVHRPPCAPVRVVETPEQLLSKSTFFVELSSEALAVSSRWLLIARGLGFGNYVVKWKSVVSANNVNGAAAGRSPHSWFCGDRRDTSLWEEGKKQPRKQLCMKRTLSPHLKSGNCGKLKYIFLLAGNRATQTQLLYCFVKVCIMSSTKTDNAGLNKLFWSLIIQSLVYL